MKLECVPRAPVTALGSIFHFQRLHAENVKKVGKGGPTSGRSDVSKVAAAKPLSLLVLQRRPSLLA